MKNLKYITSLFFVLITLVSCKKEDAFTFRTVTDDFSTTSNFSVLDISSEMTQINNSTILDISSNQDILDNQSLVIDANINSLTYQITNFSGNTETKLSNPSIIIGGVRIEIDDINLEEASNNNTIFEVYNGFLLNNSSEVFRNTTETVVLVTGAINNSPVSFDITVSINLSVTIDNL
ncbi:hypothetical protein [Winogradskyella sp. UBA3174]|uniref:hypothetical protein n=1 Tax=Winogradskyella sp. UBA3174 TaxID=1947785 RepID=UPI0025EFBFBE|nr:hypothetical protein [Winogradskyella sp. UBA3174]|tara:strand:- start:1725 stop:2258 length:534 start_codon:yes stop_codon:yes gene_type:complete